MVQRPENVFGSSTEHFHSTQNKTKGLSVFLAAVFIVGAMCGSGILALPKAVVDSGWSGLPLLIICGLISSFTGTLLGKCWIIVRQRYPDYNEQYVTDPYPIIGFRAAGKWGEVLTRCCITATLFGGGTVFLLLIAGNLNLLLGIKSLHTCFILLITWAVMTPLTFLGTPKDFWPAAIIAASTTSVAAILIVISLAAAPVHQPPIYHDNPDFVGFFNAFGTILFAFGGASCFPNIQVDMKNPEKFSNSVVIGIMTVLALYIPVSLSGFLMIGDYMTSSNILDELSGDSSVEWIRYAATSFITAHLFMAVLIVANPINQDIEGFFKLPDKFSWKRCAIRITLMTSMIFVALTIPHFGILLSLVGGTTVTATNFIFPPLFYLLLCRQKTPYQGYGNLPKSYMKSVYRTISNSIDNCKEGEVENDLNNTKNPVEQSENSNSATERAIWTVLDIPLHVKIILFEIIFIGIVGGIASTYSVISQLVDGSSGFSVPCYVNWSTAD